MDQDRFAALAHALAARLPRRAIGGTLAATLALASATADAKKKGKGKGRGKGKKPRCPGCRACGARCCPTGQQCSGNGCVSQCTEGTCGSFPSGCPLLPADNVWNARIDALPLDANSAAYVASIGANESLRADFGSGTFDGGPIGIPFITYASPPQASIAFDVAEESDRGPYRIPADAPIEGGPCGDGDRHVIVVDPDTCTVYELFDARPLANGSWTAGSGAIFDLRSNALRPDTWTSADAAGLPILPGLVTFEEAASGEIRHALRFTAARTRAAYVWPARHEASNLTDPNLPPLGQRFRLKADFDLSGFSATNRTILVALQRYGMFLADNGSNWFLSGVPDNRWDNDDLRVLLNGVKGSDFEAIDESGLMVDPNSGRVRNP